MNKTQNETIKVGEINRLLIKRDTDFGFFLEAKDESEILLPNSYIIESQMPMESLLDVFVYTDSEDRIVASTKIPYAKLGEFGYFTAVDYRKIGAFVNWGLPKDLFVPLSQQTERFEVGKKYILRVCLDKQTNRLYGTQKIGKYINRDMKGLFVKKELNGFVIAKTPLGYKVIADNQYEGMLFNNEIYEDIKVGDTKVVYIKKVREDYKLDLTLNPIGKADKVSKSEDIIIKMLQSSGGTLPFTYKSDSEDIRAKFNISKKSFKSTLTKLIESKKIELTESTIELL